MSPSDLKSEILRLTREYSRLTHAANLPGDDEAHAPFTPGETTVPYAGRVFTGDEVEAAVSATLDFWLTLGPEGEAMEKELAAFMGVKHTLLVNSGSSANLVAFSALTTHKLPAHKRIRPGDEVITVAAGFPTTVAPILQCGAVPVFIDANPLTGNADCSLLEAAFSPGKTKAVMMAHALGNPFELVTVLEFCQKHDIWLIEDNCDALGCTYTLPLEKARELGLDHLIKIAEKGEHGTIKIKAEKLKTETLKGESPESERQKAQTLKEDSEISASQHFSVSDFQLFLTAPTGSFGDLSTQSFYPPHHLTMGEGGAVNIVRKPALKTYAESFRDWGRDCWCPSGKDNTCGKRFQWQLGELPEGYDHKYIYSHLGYNLKPLDTQAAIGRVQLRRLPDFIEARKRNWERLRQGLHGLEEWIDFALPTHATAWIPPEERKAETLKTEKLKSEMLNAERALANPARAGGAASRIDEVKSEKLKKESEISAFQRFSVSAFQDGISAFQLFSFSAFSWDSTGCRTDCSWFGFKMTVRENAPFTRTELASHLDEKKIGNRMLFGGNLVRQPAFVQLKRDNPAAFRVVDCSNSQLSTLDSQLFSPLPGADRIMNRTLFLGTYPGLTRDMVEYMVQVIRNFVAEKAEKLKKLKF